jgi:hypothetical protein
MTQFLTVDAPSKRRPPPPRNTLLAELPLMVQLISVAPKSQPFQHAILCIMMSEGNGLR